MTNGTAIRATGTNSYAWLPTTWIRTTGGFDLNLGTIVTNSTSTNAWDISAIVPVDVNTIFIKVQISSAYSAQSVNLYTRTDLINTNSQFAVNCQVAGQAVVLTQPLVIGTNRTIYYVNNVTNIPNLYRMRITGGLY